MGENSSDIWGFVDDAGIEYAVIGTRTSTRIYSLEDPRNPIERYRVPGAASIWRDIKYYNKHLYATTDQGRDGLLIIDVSGAPENYTHTFWKPSLTINGATDSLHRVHNLYIDEKGFCYLAGHNISRRGVMILDLKQDPKNPELVGAADLFYSHDAFTRGDTLYSSELNNGLAIYDVSDKANVREIGRATTSNNFTHNAWLSADGKYVYTTDEVAFGYVDAYDISDLPNIKFLDKFRSPETLSKRVIPHNTHYHQGFNVVSWYTDGLVVFDSSRPDNLIKTACYDTYDNALEANLPQNGNWFEGCWGAYPYLPSGILLGSDINTGLYVVDIDYVRACWLEGSVFYTDLSGNRINLRDATVRINSNQLATSQTDIMGAFKTGLATAGTYEVVVSHPNFNEKTVTVILTNGELTEVEIELEASYITGSVVNVNGTSLSEVQIGVTNLETNTVTNISNNPDGTFTIPVAPGSKYDLYFGKWGYKHEAFNSVSVENSGITVTLEEGYQDDFFADLGWTVAAQAARGNWTRAQPIGTIFNGDLCNPDADVDGDIGNFAFVTGNGGGEPGFDDLDEGITRLTSPAMDWTDWDKAFVNYHTWFYNAGGNSTPNDTMKVYLSNGAQQILLETIRSSSTEWSELKTVEIEKDGSIIFTDNMRLIFTASDFNPGHLVEAGVDAISVIGEITNSTSNPANTSFLMVPNPAKDQVQILTSDTEFTLEIIDAYGRIVRKINDQKIINTQQFESGIYFVKYSNDQRSTTKKLVIIE